MTNLNTPFMIGDVEIPNRTVLAPMAGVTNSAFRTIAKELGAGLVVMEMVSDKGIQYNNEKTLHMLHIDEGENPVSIQLFGSDEDSLARAAEFIQENTKTDIVDINMGCPVNKIVKNEAGAMWLKDPDKIYSIINKVQSVLDIPLTVKMRTGWSDPSLAVENALAAEAAGVSALAMHGRTREQMYTGHADLETLHKVAQALTKIPFIANGDIRTVQDAKQRIEEVGADAVMIGRAAMGNPYLFNQINHYFETGEILPDLTFEDKMKIAYEHLKRLIDLKGEHIAVREFRGLAPHYLRGTSGAAKLRGAISQASTLAEIEELLQLNRRIGSLAGRCVYRAHAKRRGTKNNAHDKPHCVAQRAPSVRFDCRLIYPIPFSHHVEHRDFPHTIYYCSIYVTRVRKADQRGRRIVFARRADARDAGVPRREYDPRFLAGRDVAGHKNMLVPSALLLSTWFPRLSFSPCRCWLLRPTPGQTGIRAINGTSTAELQPKGMHQR